MSLCFACFFPSSANYTDIKSKSSFHLIFIVSWLQALSLRVLMSIKSKPFPPFSQRVHSDDIYCVRSLLFASLSVLLQKLNSVPAQKLCKLTISLKGLIFHSHKLSKNGQLHCTQNAFQAMQTSPCLSFGRRTLKESLLR